MVGGGTVVPRRVTVLRREAKRRMRPILRMITPALTGAAAVILSGACSNGMFRLGGSAPPPPEEQTRSVLVDGRPMVTESDRSSEFGGGEDAVRLQMTFDVLRVDLPVRGIRHSLKVWNHVDETQADPRLTASLARNGLRMGTATADAWPALCVLFEANGAKSLHARHVVQSGAPLSVRLGEVESGETIFGFERDGRLWGRTFQRGTKFLHVDYALDLAAPTRTILKVTPEVRSFSAGKHWQNIDGRIREVPHYEGRIFSELSAEFSVGPDEFLVIGQSETARLASLVGSRFLTSKHNNVTYETVIRLTPRPLRVDRSGR